MEIGDLIKRKKEYRYMDNTQNLAYIIGFDRDGDIEIVYLNPDPIRGAFPDIDYKSRWELVNATTKPKSRTRRYC